MIQQCQGDPAAKQWEKIHVGDCNSGTEFGLGSAENPDQCLEKCLDYTPDCKYFTMHADGSGACYYESSSSSYSSSTAWAGYEVLKSCGTFWTCFEDVSLSDNYWAPGDYSVQLVESSANDALCSDHAFTINAKLTLNCQGNV